MRPFRRWSDAHFNNWPNGRTIDFAIAGRGDGGHGRLLERAPVRIRFRRHFRHQGQQRHPTSHAHQQPLLQRLLGHSDDQGKTQLKSTSKSSFGWQMKRILFGRLLGPSWVDRRLVPSKPFQLDYWLSADEVTSMAKYAAGGKLIAIIRFCSVSLARLVYSRPDNSAAFSLGPVFWRVLAPAAC